MYPTSMSNQVATARVLPTLVLSLLIATVGLFLGSKVPTVFMMPLLVVELIMIFSASFVRRRRVGYGFLYSFTLISGVTLFPTINYYTQNIGGYAVLEAFAVTVIAFGAAAIYVKTTRANFNFLAGFLFMGVIALMGIGLAGLFLPFSHEINQIYTFLGVLVFIGYMLFDLSRIINQGVATEDVPGVVLSLYLDFVNLFLFILRLIGINVKRD
jgi:uncharacterized protein